MSESKETAMFIAIPQNERTWIVENFSVPSIRAEMSAWQRKVAYLETRRIERTQPFVRRT